MAGPGFEGRTVALEPTTQYYHAGQTTIMKFQNIGSSISFFKNQGYVLFDSACGALPLTKNLRGTACRFLFPPPCTTSFSQYSNLQIPVTTEALNSYSYTSQLNKNALCTWAHLLAPQSGRVSSVRQGAHDAAFSSPGMQSHSSCYLTLENSCLMYIAQFYSYSW